MIASLHPVLALLLGVIFAAAGGEMFLRGAVGISRSLRLSQAVVGATVAAFATSSPELSVSIGSALAGTPEIALGDALGSNVVNVALILALALLMGPVRCPPESVRRDLSTAIAAPVFFSLLCLDGVVSRADGVIMMGAFLVWLGFVIRDALLNRTPHPEMGEIHTPFRRAIVALVVGLGFLIMAAKFIVAGAQGVAAWFHLPLFVVGAVIVAVGTSTPELVTTLYARWKGHDDIGLGNIVGSNVFNLLFIVALAALIRPIELRGSAHVLPLAFGTVVTALCWPGRAAVLGRTRGVILLVIYAAFVAATLAGSGEK